MPAKAKLTTRERTSSNISSDNLNKGSELSFAEADSNFINLRDQTIAISDGTTSTDIEAGETITFSGASVSGNTVTVPTGAGMTVVGDDSSGTLINGGETLKIAGGTNITTAMSGDTLTITGAGGSSSSGGNLGDLQVNGTVMTPVSTNADLTLDANGTGDVVIKGAIFETDPSTSPSFTGTGISAGSTTTSRIEFHDNGTLYHRAGSAFNALSSSGYDLNLYTNQKVRAINATGIVVGNSNIDVEIESKSGGSLTLKTGEGDNPDVSGFIKIQDGANQDITITPNGSGKIILDGLNWPTADGSANQVLQTDGSGNLSFADASGGSTGDITFNGSTMISPSNGDITLDPSGTGDINLSAREVFIGDSSTDSAIISTETDRHLYLAQNMNLASDFSTNAGGFIQIAANGTLFLRPANGNQYIYNESSTVYFGRSANAASMLSGFGRSATTLTTNAYSNGWEPRILFTPPGATASAEDKALSKITMDAGATGSGSIEMTTVNILMTRLPTSDPTTAGQLWNDSGTLKISAG